MYNFIVVTEIKIDDKLIPINYIGICSGDLKVLIFENGELINHDAPLEKIGLYRTWATGSSYAFYFDGKNKRTDFKITKYRYDTSGSSIYTEE